MSYLRYRIRLVAAAMMAVSLVAGAASAQDTFQDDFGLADASDPNAYRAVIAKLKDVADANSEQAIAQVSNVKDLIARLQRVQSARQIAVKAADDIQGAITDESKEAVEDVIEQRRGIGLAVDCSTPTPQGFAQARIRTSMPSDLATRLIAGGALCAAAKRDIEAMRVGNPHYDAIKRIIEQELAAEESSRKSYQDAKQEVGQVAGALKEAALRLEARTDAKLRNINSVSTLPWIVAAICIFCIGVMFTVKQFSEHIQIEWVATGQATQFVTIILLLSVITMLAINERIGENTLGTLLGGVAGYVLAQGVGRSSARETERKIRAESQVQ